LFDTLLVYRVDRFSRRLRDLTTLLDDLDETGVVFGSATEPFDTSTAVGRILVQMLHRVAVDGLLIVAQPAEELLPALAHAGPAGRCAREWPC